ncbi:MAG TPA: hypothetical protein VGG64_15600 [Pirellulales bacterium]|jgi:hypothetical protein
MLIQEIQAELRRLQLHPVNLDASAGENGNIVLNGSLLAHWSVPRNADGQWFLAILRTLPDLAGPEATMNAFCAAYAEQARTV